MKRRQNVILVEDRWWSHHPIWFKLILSFFLEKTNYDLGVICAFPEDLQSWLQSKYPKQKSRVRLQYLKYFEELNYRSTNRVKNFYLKIRPIWRFRIAIRKMQKTLCRNPEFVFFGAIDDILHTCLPTKICNLIFTFRWTGIYHRPVHVESVVSGCTPERVARVASMKTCLGIYHFQEDKEAEMIRDFGVQVKYFPELTDCEIDQGESRIVIDIKKRAGNRKIIGVSGLIQPPKGIFTMLEIAHHTKDKYFFVFIGFNDSPGGPEIMEKIKRKFKEENLENCFTYFNKVEKDGEFNQILESFDLIWAAYENFPWSSNHLGKAAILKKPIIVSDSGLMSYRVKKYNLGLVMKEGSSLDGYVKIKEYFTSSSLKEHGFSNYCEQNSIKLAYELFGDLLTAYRKNRLSS